MLSFDYSAWNPDKHLLMRNASNSYAVTVLRNGIKIGHMPTKSLENRRVVTRAAVQGTIEMLAACIEWLRWYGVPEAEVQNRVKTYISGQRESNEGKARIAAGKYEDQIADALNVKHRITDVVK